MTHLHIKSKSFNFFFSFGRKYWFNRDSSVIQGMDTDYNTTEELGPLGSIAETTTGTDF